MECHCHFAAVCLLPLPLVSAEAIYQSCCGKTLCAACVTGMERAEAVDRLRDMMRGLGRPPDGIAGILCPFCRAVPPKGKREVMKRFQDRVDVGCAQTVHLIGMYHKEGSSYWEVDPEKALEHWFRAATMGWKEAHRDIGDAYDEGYGFLPIDESKAAYHYSLAAIAGDVVSRYNLGVIAANSGDYDRAYRHWCIVAKQGNETALERVAEGFRAGYLGREEYAEVLRVHERAVDSMASSERRKVSEEKPHLQHLPEELRNKPILKGDDDGTWRAPLPPPRNSAREESASGRQNDAPSFEDFFGHMMSQMFGMQNPSPSEAEASSEIEQLVDAVGDGQLSLVRRMLKKNPGLSTMQQYRFGSAITPLEMAATSHHEDNLAIAKLLVANGADVNGRDPQFGQQPLHRACEGGVLNLISYLIDQGADPNSRDRTGQTCLHFAAEHGRADACRLLLERGAGPSLVVRYEGKTPRQWAERGGHVECARIL